MKRLITVMVSTCLFASMCRSNAQTSIAPSERPKGELVEQATGEYSVQMNDPLTRKRGTHSPSAAPGAGAAKTEKWWLHVKWKRSCYGAYAEYYAEAKVTSGIDFNSQERAVQSLSVGSYGPWRFNKQCSNTSVCARDDREYGLNFSCKRPICVRATAKDPSGTASNASLEKNC